MMNPKLSGQTLHWYVLIAKGHEHQAIADVRHDNLLRDSSEYKLEVFTTCYGANRNNTNSQRRTSLLIPSYVFIRGTEADVRRLKYKYSYFKIPRIAYTDGVLTHIPYVTDSQMASLRIAIECAGCNVTYFKPGEIDLESGDRVRIISGPLAGVEGILISSQGKSGGAVHIEVHNLFVARTVSVSAEQMEILSFSSKSNTRLYDNFDKFYSVVSECIRKYLANSLSDKEKAGIRVLVSRFQNLEVTSANTRAKLSVLLLLSYRMLGMSNMYEVRLRECKVVTRSLSSELQKVFNLVYMYACTGDRCLEQECGTIIDGWDADTLRKSKMKYDIARDFRYFQNLFA